MTHCATDLAIASVERAAEDNPRYLELLLSKSIDPRTQRDRRNFTMDNIGMYLWLWILIAPLLGIILLSGMGSSRNDRNL